MIISKLKRQSARAKGDQLERLIYGQCVRMGWFVQRIATPSRAGRYVSAVVGDLIGCDHRGVGVLIECKYRATGKPVRSDLKPHQHAALMQFIELGGLAYVAWMQDGRPQMALYSQMWTTSAPTRGGKADGS